MIIQTKKPSSKIIAVFTLIAIAILLFLRKPDAIINPQFWAEDGLVVFKQSIELGFKSIIIPHVGCIHLISSLVSYIGALFPYKYAPAATNIGSFLVFLFVCAQFFSDRLELPLKPLFALSLILLPNYGEVYINAGNLQSITAILLLLLLFKKPPSNKAEIIFDFTILILAGLTGPYMIFAWPLYCYKYLRERNNYNGSLLLVATIIALLQIFITLTYYAYIPFHYYGKGYDDDVIPHHPFSFSSWKIFLEFIGIRVLGGLFLGSKSLTIQPHVLTILFFLLIGAIYYLVFKDKRKVYLVNCFLLFSLINLLGTWFRVGNPAALVWMYNGDHYFYLINLMIVWSLLICLSMTGYRQFIAAVLLIFILINSFTHFKATPLVDFHWRNYADKINKVPHLEIPINPPGWKIKFSN